MSESDELQAPSTANPYLETIGGEAGKYGPDTRLELLRLMADGRMLGEACDALGVPRGAPYWWGKADPRYAVALSHARKAGAAFLAGETLGIADEPGLDRDGVQQARVRIAARQWLAGRLDPEAWSERSQVQHTVSDVRRTAFVSFLGQRPVVEAEATVVEVREAEGQAAAAAEENASTEAVRTGDDEPAGARGTDGTSDTRG